MAMDQFGLVKCGELIRVMKGWLRGARKDSCAYWERIAGAGVQILRSIQLGLERALMILDASARTIRILPDDIKIATQLIENSQAEQNRQQERSDHELHYSVKVKIGSLEPQQSDSSRTVAGVGNVKFRLGIHTAEDDESSSLLVPQDQTNKSDEMIVTVDLGLKQDISGTCVICVGDADG